MIRSAMEQRAEEEMREPEMSLLLVARRLLLWDIFVICPREDHLESERDARAHAQVLSS